MEYIILVFSIYIYIYIISFILSILPKLILGKRAELVMIIIIRKLVISVGLTTIAVNRS